MGTGWRGSAVLQWPSGPGSSVTNCSLFLEATGLSTVLSCDFIFFLAMLGIKPKALPLSPSPSRTFFLLFIF